jgi:hypothetical protein
MLLGGKNEKETKNNCSSYNHVPVNNVFCIIRE